MNIPPIACFVTGIISIFALAPLTLKLCKLIRKGKDSEDGSLHVMDNSATSIVIVILMIIVYQVIIEAIENRKTNLKQQAVTHLNINK